MPTKPGCSRWTNSPNAPRHISHRRDELTQEKDTLTARSVELANENRIRRGLAGFAERVAASLDKLDPDARQRLLRLVIEKVRVTGWRVEIHLKIPLTDDGPDENRPPFSANPDPQTPTVKRYQPVGTAMWTYLTQPFCLTLPGFLVEELSPWREEGKVLRRLRVRWPDYLASHSSTQTLYFDGAGRVARHDYEVEIVAGAPAAHLFDGFVTVDGITLPTHHRIYGRDATGRIDTSSVIVSIDIDDVAFGQI